MICGNPSCDNLVLAVVLASFDSGSVTYSLIDGCIRNHKRDNLSNTLTPLVQQKIQSLSLCQSPRVSVQQKAIHFSISGKFRLYHTFHNLVRHQTARINQLPRLLAQFRALSHFLAEQLPGGNVFEIISFRNCSGLCPFSGTRRPEYHIIFHFFCLFGNQ